MNAGEYAKENGLPLQDVLAQFGLTHHKQKIPEGESKMDGEVQVVEPVVVQEEVKKPSDGIVRFYWRDGRNTTFTIRGDIVNGVQQNGRFYKTEKSVIRLHEKADAKAINYLRAHAGNEANGGKDFGEFDAAKLELTEKGSMIDKLMALDIKTLAQMVGGGVAATRRSKGQLISEILGLKG